MVIIPEVVAADSQAQLSMHLKLCTMTGWNAWDIVRIKEHMSQQFKK